MVLDPFKKDLDRIGKALGFTSSCSPEVIKKVRNTTYYHGYRRGPRWIRKEMYFTSGKEWAEDFCGGSSTPEGFTYNIVKAKINPLNPYCAQGPVSAATELPLDLIGELRKLVPAEATWEQLQRGEGFVSGQIRRAGFDAWIRDDGEVVVVYDYNILTVLATTLWEPR